ncbi:MAG: coproporphyrinogen III oxidase family protein, partial [Deltaproteobacteria bacterium]|nr:coproporphyrinogen III oxidase family protein [Deltaproteobacteria bacterium]
ALLFGLGFTRVSVGVQSFIQPELEFLGRRHNAARAVRSVKELREAGFTNIGLDLIQAMPGQTVKARMESLGRALELGPQHISCYELTFEDGTPFGDAREKGLLTPPNQDDAAEGFQATSRFMRERGFVHYEVSNYALGPQNRSRHNRKYWAHTPYLGLGPAAHSFDGRRRWWNVPGVEEYVRRAANGWDTVQGSESLTDEQLRLERLALGFRTMEGVERADLGDGDSTESLLARVRDEGLVLIEGDRVKPTVDGMRVADGLARGFMNA